MHNNRVNQERTKNYFFYIMKSLSSYLFGMNMADNYISVDQISNYMKKIVSISKELEIDEETLNTIINRTNLLVDPAIEFDKKKLKNNNSIDSADLKEVLISVFSALSECTILDLILEFSPKDQRYEDNILTQDQSQEKIKFSHKQVSKEVRTLIASVVFLIQLDGSIKFKNGKSSGHNKLTMKYILNNIGNPENFSFVDFLEDRFANVDNSVIEKLSSLKMNEISFGLGITDRTLWNWVYGELPVYFHDLLFTEVTISDSKHSRRTDTNTKCEVFEITNILDELERPIVDKQHEIDFDFPNCINLDGKIVTFDELSRFSGSALLVAPIKGGKTHLLKLLANFSNKFVYINLLDMSIVKEFDTVRFLSNNLFLRSKTSKVKEIPNISLDILRNYIVLFDNFDKLPTTEQMAVIYQLSIVPNIICGTSLSYSPLFFTKHQFLQKPLNPVVFCISPSAGYLSSIFQTNHLSNQEMARIETLTFSRYPGGLDYISQHARYSFSELVTGFCDYSISNSIKTIQNKELKTLQKMVRSKVSSDVGIQLFSNLFYIYIKSKDTEIYKKFDLFLKNFYITLKSEEEKQLLDSSESILLQKIIKISDHKLRFHYDEFLWVFLVDLLDSFSEGENFRAAQLGYRLCQNSAWAFFFDYFDHRQYK